jgi:hypothetical protein
MSLSNKPLEFIDESDLQSLVDNQRLESKTIEYKESLPDNSDSDKKEFLAEVSSFTNAAGGDLIFGIKEIEGVPSELSGLELSNVDAEKLRLENIIRDGIEPRIPAVSIQPILLQTKGSKVAIVIRIPRSWALPHMVTFKGHSRFYSRNSAGKYPLDVSEIRVLFALSETTAERINNFRLERLSKIISGETPVALDKVSKIVLHIIPFGAFDPAARFDVSSLERDIGLLQPMCASGWDHRHNFDGFLTYGQFPNSTSAHTYLQIFRNGIIEAVEAFLLRGIKDPTIPSEAYEKELLDALPRFLSIQKKLGVEPPLFIMLTLLGVAGYTMAVDRSHFIGRSNYPIERDSLLIPEVMIEKFECNPAEVMRPAFDAVWNAAGWPKSMNYNDEGKWVGQ